MLAVRTPGAPQAAREDAAFDSAFPFERQAGTWRAGRFEDRQAGDCDPVASCRLPSVLALEIKTAQWPSKDPAGNPSAHSRDQSRQPIMGRTTASWRASQARHRCRTNHRCKVYGEGKATTVPRVEDVPY